MTLYRKYRPKKFSEVVGRDAIAKILSQEIKQDRVSHAYLFSGTRGTGKTTIARIFAKSLNCENRDKDKSEPCNECKSCISINESRSQDLVEIDAASNRRIEEIRELREHVKYVPSNSKYKVYIIDEVHMLTPEAFNALLKTLEEPPAHVIFILATTELHKIPETIFSRCQHFSFGKVGIKDTIERLNRITKLEKAEVEPEVIKDIARRSGGALRDAESLLGQILSIGKKITSKDAEMFLPKVGFSRTIDWINFLVLNDSDKSLKMLEELEKQGINLVFFIAESLETARQMMIYVATKDEDRLKMYFTDDEINNIKQICENISQLRIRTIVIELLRACQDMKLSPDIPSLPIELAVIMICDENKINSPQIDHQKSKKEFIQNKNNEVEKNDFSQSSNVFVKKDILEEENIKFDKDKAQEPKKENTYNTVHSLEQILDGWGEVLTKVKDKNQSLNFVLGVAQPVGVNGNILELGFKYKLQLEKISEIKNRDIVENIIKEVYGIDYHIEPVITEDILQNYPAKPSNIENKPEEKDKFVEAALQVFEGAEIVS